MLRSSFILLSRAILIMAVVFASLLSCLGGPPKRTPLTPEQQKAFLSKRTTGRMMGTFNSFASLLYAVNDVAIHTESQTVNQTELNSPFPDFYRATWEEMFDTMARQTGSSWKYDASQDFWVFTPPVMALPYDIQIAKGWTSHDEGMYTGYQPPKAPVGLDIYMLGHYSSTNAGGEAELFTKIRETLALRLAKSFKADIKVGDMTEVPVGGVKALHFKGTGPTGVVWRQWVLVDSGKAFAIVSAIKPELDKEIYPDVEQMVKSFKVKAGADAAGSKGKKP